MQQIPTVSLIISTYNWPEALIRVLDSVKQQSVLPKEVLIADDGSGEATRLLIERYQQDFPVPLIHVWHEDKGFRLAAIRNKAILRSESEYIINIDGDIVLHRHFMSDHLAAATKGYFVTGSRVMLKEDFSRRILEQGLQPSIFCKGIGNRHNCLRVGLLSRLFYTCKQDMDKVRGCNMAFWRADLLAVNGFEEAFEGWGSEDHELMVRLYNHGIKRRRLKFGAIAYHIYHKENDRSSQEQNKKLLLRSIQEGKVKSCQGLQQYTQH